MCGITEKSTRECTCGPCTNCLRRDCPGAPGAAAVTKLKCVFLLPKYPPQSEVRQAKGPLGRKMYEDLGHVYAKYFDVPYEVSELETVPEADEKSWTTEGEASVLELEQSATERDVAHIVEGHEDLLAMRDQMFIDDANTPCLVGYETIHFDSGANCILLKSDAMLAASKQLDSSKGALGTASQSGKLTHEGTANVTMYVKGGANEHSPIELEGYRAPKAKRNVVPPQALEALGATIGLHRTKYDDATWDITFPNGHTWLALKDNGLLFGFVKLDAQENAEASVTEAEELEATMKRGDVPPHVWAARLVTGVDG